MLVILHVHSLTMVWLIIQTGLALVALHFLVRVVLPSLEQVPDRGHLLDVWIPVALIMPMVCYASFAGGGQVGLGWVAIGGPIVVGLIAMGAALFTSATDARELQMPLPVTAAWLGAGVLLVLVASLGDLSVWTGQCAFAIGAVLLWLNAPEREAPVGDRRSTDRIGWAMLIVLAASAGSAVAALAAGTSGGPISGAIMLVVAAMTVAAAARLDGGASALRLGAWCGVYGLLFGLGVIAFSVLFPLVFNMMQGEQMTGVQRVSYGFGEYAAEGIVLVVLPLVPAVAQQLAPGWRRVGGVLLLLVGAILAGARLASLPG
jgi:hypothetical protein